MWIHRATVKVDLVVQHEGTKGLGKFEAFRKGLQYSIVPCGFGLAIHFVVFFRGPSDDNLSPRVGSPGRPTKAKFGGPAAETVGMLPGHVLGEFVPRFKFSTPCCHNFLPHLNKFDILGRSIVDGTFDGFVGVGETLEEEGLNLLLDIGSRNGRNGRNGRKKGNERHLGNHFERKGGKEERKSLEGFYALIEDRQEMERLADLQFFPKGGEETYRRV